MPVAGLLLTGGSSRRMGRDKAAILLEGTGESLAERTARLLAAVAEPALEVGPGCTRLAGVTEEKPASGPLYALAAGNGALNNLGWRGHVLVVATDLPLLSGRFLAWLAARPGPRSVVPEVGGRPQPLCARYSPGDLVAATTLVSRGARSMNDLLRVIDVDTVTEKDWVEGGDGADVLFDVDTPEDLAIVLRKSGREAHLDKPVGLPGPGR
jgi:molybdopterin-guanine dinucleotide biosynthesis protein A